MTTRDRLALIGISTLAVLGLVWLMLVSPERKEASTLSSQITQAKEQLSKAEGEAASARSAQARYSAAYASVVKLGKAVPPSEEVPALIYQLAQASNQRHVEFNSITTGSSAAGATAASASSTTAASAAAGGAFTQMPFTFVFNGSFADLYHLFRQLDQATARTSSGGLHVSGRLLTLQGMKLQPQSNASGGGLSGTITATAYVLPASAGLTGGSTPAAPASSATGSTTAASGSAPTSSAPPAVVTAGATR
ncbi:MAG TPA: type II secretion system protein GspM [Solirubrobacteraceae bacterium]|jgi:Tfp pilus assembly protein PilO